MNFFFSATIKIFSTKMSSWKDFNLQKLLFDTTCIKEYCVNQSKAEIMKNNRVKKIVLSANRLIPEKETFLYPPTSTNRCKIELPHRGNV